MWVSPGQQVTHVGLLLQGQVAGGGVSFDPCCLEDFEMMQVLGTGSFGRVTLAKHRESETVCAVKALSKAHMLKNQQVSSRKANSASTAQRCTCGLLPAPAVGCLQLTC